MPAGPNTALAIALMLAATVFIALASLMAKALGTDSLGPPLHPLQVTFGRFVFAWVTVGTVAATLRLRLTRVHLTLHVSRTFFGWLGITLIFAAVAMIPLSDATAISFLNPIFAMIFAVAFLGERVGAWRWGAAVAAFSGALILLRPGGGAVEAGALLALASAVVIGFEIILIKRLSGREGPLQILLVNNSIGACIATLGALAVWTAPTPAQWMTLGALGACMACAQGFFVNAVARAEASLVVPFSYATLLFAALFDLMVFDILPDAVSITGAAVIVAAGLVLAWREGRAQGLSR